jgi:chemotaxis protein methyltransferase CheR
MAGVDELSEADFQRIAAVIQAQVGIRMPPAKRTMVEGRLRKRVRSLGLRSLSHYCDTLFEQGGLERELVNLIDAVTTNKTEFFREPVHFDFLRDEAVPTLLAERPAGASRLKLWSAAASTGAEAYTMAMVLADMAAAPRVPFQILGTDVCTEVLQQAVQAVYPLEMMAPVPDALQRRYVMRARDRTRAVVRIVPELRRLVRFMRLNLMEAPYPVDGDVDVIFCRNILIYFDRPTQQMVLEQLCGHLRRGGYLFLGHSESMAGGQAGMRQVAPTIFRRV